MTEVHEAPAGGKGEGASPATGAAQPAQFRAWLADLRAQIDDLHAAAEDATRPPARRDLGRRAARVIIRDAYRAIDHLLTSRAGVMP